MKKTIDDAIAKVKLWQEECKLVVMFFGAVTTVAVFFRQLMMGKIGLEQVKGIKALEVSGGGGGIGSVEMPKLALSTIQIHQSPDYVLIASGILFVIFLGLGIYYLIKTIKKYRKES